MATTSGSGNVYHDVRITGEGRAHLGNNYNYGPSEDEKILESVLASLYYPDMGERARTVSDTADDIFEWIFQRPSIEGSSAVSRKTEEAARAEKEQNASKLVDWVRSEEGGNILWITGEPGSGKSTLMKFLRDHDMTEVLLREWAGHDKLIVADHFFWLPGRPLQQLFESLLRSLLRAILGSLSHDIVSARIVCGKRWSLSASYQPPTLRELKAMMRNLSTLAGI